MSGSLSGTGLTRVEIGALVLSCLQDVLAMRDDGHSSGPLGGDTRLIGRDGVLDSMGLVTLIVDVEQRLEEEHDIVVVLADDRAMSQKRSPFRTVGSLSDYVCHLLEDEG
jgi:acyl carrier protein